jgi:hypothetical protein
VLRVCCPVNWFDSLQTLGRSPSHATCSHSIVQTSPRHPCVTPPFFPNCWRSEANRPHESESSSFRPSYHRSYMIITEVRFVPAHVHLRLQGTAPVAFSDTFMPSGKTPLRKVTLYSHITCCCAWPRARFPGPGSTMNDHFLACNRFQVSPAPPHQLHLPLPYSKGASRYYA